MLFFLGGGGGYNKYLVAGTCHCLGYFVGKYGIMSIQFQQSGKVHGIMGIHFETRRNLESPYLWT